MTGESEAGARLGQGAQGGEESPGRELGAARVVIVSGMSGSGKSTAMKALEDAGFFCIDNMPVPLLPRVLELAASRGDGRQRPYAFAIDTRSQGFLAEVGGVIDQLIEEGVQVQVIYLEAHDDVLVRRYSETRRRHPMSGDGGTVREGIERERAALAAVRCRANAIIDTTEHTVHTLKAMVQEMVSEVSEPSLTVTVLSFGFKYGVPPDCDVMFDLRFLPNPYFLEDLRAKNGLDREVADYVLSFVETVRFVELCVEMMAFTLPLYEREGKTYLTIGIGCTGGKHRSVAVSEVICSRLRGRGWNADTRHRERASWTS